MVLSALLGVALAVLVCVAGIRHAFRLLGLGVMETMLWLGVLEVPKPAVSRRPTERARRAAASPRTASLRRAA